MIAHIKELSVPLYLNSKIGLPKLRFILEKEQFLDMKVIKTRRAFSITSVRTTGENLKSWREITNTFTNLSQVRR